MNVLKKLAGQTAIYGLSSIVGRLLNYLLVPLHTINMFSRSEYGVIGELYAYAGLLLVMLTFGMETAFFRFSENQSDKNKVYASVLLPIMFVSLLFLTLIFLFITPISQFIQFSGHTEYIKWFALITAADAVSDIPFSRLRLQNRAMRFAVVRLINIGINIGFNLIFLVLLPFLYKNFHVEILSAFEKPDIAFVFIANLMASLATLVLLLPEFSNINLFKNWDFALFKTMLKYAFPLLLMGIAIIVNETLDRVLIKHWVTIPEGIENATEYAQSQVGIYSANYKIAVFMTLFIQMFRYAAEPFFFAQAKEKNSKETYALVMKYFVLFGLFIFLGIILYLDIFKHFIGKDYWSGLVIVPIILLANLWQGIIYNLSVWYKINNLTKFGAIIAGFGAAITLLLNYILIPRIGYIGAAWATFACYFSMMILSYFLSLKYYPIPYHFKTIGAFGLIAILLYAFSQFWSDSTFWVKTGLNTLLFLLFTAAVAFSERKLLFKK